MKRVLLLSALVPMFVACAGAEEGASAPEASGEQEVQAACTPHFADAKTLRDGINNKVEAQRMAGAYFFMTLGIESNEAPSFIYKNPASVTELQKRADDLKVALKGKAALIAAVDSLVADATKYNLQGKDDATIASSFHCLSADSKAIAVKNVNFQEKPLDLTTAKAKPLLDKIMIDVEDESNVWGDTILEGPYATTEGGKVSIYSSEELRLNNKRIAIRITFGEKAVMTDSDGCELGADEETWSDECQRGTIQQTLHFDANISRIGVEDDYPDFYEE